MQLDYAGLFLDALLEIFPPMLDFFLPIILWVTIPGVLAIILFNNKNAYTVGGFLGFIGALTIGPLSSNPIF